VGKEAGIEVPVPAVRQKVGLKIGEKAQKIARLIDLRFEEKRKRRIKGVKPAGTRLKPVTWEKPW